ncbi:MAG TPA: hypothetical protein VGS10_07160 [Terracidiphilus sp.]|nr:hypothetical protein [Terracidiphilus sp.]
MVALLYRFFISPGASAGRFFVAPGSFGERCGASCAGLYAGELALHTLVQVHSLGWPTVFPLHTVGGFDGNLGHDILDQAKATIMDFQAMVLQLK